MYSDCRSITFFVGVKCYRRMQEDVDPHYYESNKHKMLKPRTIAEKITDMAFNDKEYRNGVTVDLPN
jgi:hypothetical protein